MISKDDFCKRLTVNHENGCWEWNMCLDDKGYGKIGFEGNVYRAHRVSYELFVGEIGRGLGVCHKCDNPKCVNPAHLFLGTHKDNMVDRNRKGRARGGSLAGEKNKGAKLTSLQVAKIKSELNSGRMQSEIAREYGVSATAIWKIKHGLQWRGE